MDKTFTRKNKVKTLQVMSLNRVTGFRIYDILVEECGAPTNPGERYKRDRWAFVNWFTAGPGNEYRFEGKLGFSGKVSLTPLRRGRVAHGIRLECAEATALTPEYQQMIDRANARISGLPTQEMRAPRLPKVRQAARTVRAKLPGIS